MDSGNEVQLYKKNLYPPPPAKCPNFYRLQRFRMRCHSKSGQNSRLMERQSVGLAHQYKGTNGSFSCSTAVSSQLPEWSRTAVFRQYNSCCLLKPSRGDKIGPAFNPYRRDIMLVPGKKHILVGDSHTRFKKFICRPSVTSKKSFNRMDAKSSSFSSHCGHLWPSRYPFFRFCPKSSGKEICLLCRRPKGPGHRCTFNQLGGDQLMYAFPPFSLIQRYLQMA